MSSSLPTRSASAGISSGTAGWGINASIVNFPRLDRSIQTAAIVVGHILGVILAHDRALALFPGGAAPIEQIPLLVVMVGYTVAALLLLFTE